MFKLATMARSSEPLATQSRLSDAEQFAHFLATGLARWT